MLEIVEEVKRLEAMDLLCAGSVAESGSWSIEDTSLVPASCVRGPVSSPQPFECKDSL